MSVDVYAPFPFNNVALVAWGGFGPSNKNVPFGLDAAVLKSTLYLGKGVLYVAWLFLFYQGTFFSQTPVRVALLLTQSLVQVLLSLT
jgi:hypothetical protein